MTTIALKTKYSIGLDGRAHWTGRCPTCDERFVNPAILRHEKAHHEVKS